MDEQIQKNLILSWARLIFISLTYAESVDLKDPTVVQFLLTINVFQRRHVEEVRRESN